MKPKGKQIADYVWLNKGRKYCNIWAGNPFCISLYRISLRGMSESEVIKLAKKENAKEKIRFTKKFKDVEWRSFN